MSPDKPSIEHLGLKSKPSTQRPESEQTSAWDVRLITCDDPDYNAALHLAVCGNAPRGSRRNAAVDELLSDTIAGPLRLELVHGAYRDGRLVCAALVVESPGGSGLVIVPPLPKADWRLLGTGLAIRALASAAWSRSYAMLEVLLPPEVTQLADALRMAGFRFLTNLIYLHRSIEPDAGLESRLTGTEELTWVTYSESKEPLFCEAVRRSYVQSSDCPELTAIRTPQQALASHRAAGVHQPELWFVALRANDPIGVLLLSQMRRHPTVEIVYMGVAQPARGTGVADALMLRAVQAARSVSATSLALATDERNAAARRFYERWNFSEAGVRSAWIATPGEIGACGSESGFQC